MMKVIQQIGTLTVEVAGDGPKEIIQQLSFFGSLPAVCPFQLGDEVCAHALQLTFKVVVPKSGEHKGKTLKYYGLRCANAPAHECNFGQRADDGSIFYKGAESFGLEYKAREAQESGHGGYEDHGNGGGQARDDFNDHPRRHPDGWEDKTAQQQQTPASRDDGAGPSGAQRNMLSKTLTEAGIDMKEAYRLTGATMDFDTMNPGQAGRFIGTLKQKLAGVKF